jgi:ribonuclease J
MPPTADPLTLPTTQTEPRPSLSSNDHTVEVIPLGGAAEIGKNMIVVRSGDDIIVIDAGVTFPDADHPGVDLIIPDFTYLVDNADSVRGIVLTHGHEDHIGALPFLLRRIQVPVFGTALTIGLARERLDEHGLLAGAELNVIRAGERVSFGSLTVEPIRVTHSIPDTVSLAIHTPVGIIVHTGDFKVDHTPVDGRGFDAARFAELGDEGVMLLISDTVNAEKKGWVPSESVVGRVFDEHFGDAPGRVLVTTFASNIHRIQQFLDAADQHGRKAVIAGRSMIRNIRVARELGYLHYRDDLVIGVEEMNAYEGRDIAILTTGSQGEPLSALSQIARDTHKIRIRPGDTVIMSSTPIPGNEDAIWRTVNRLIRLGARVFYDILTPVHVSGHANQEELKLMFSLTKPLFVVPFHGEPRMMQAYTDMVTAMGMDEDRVIWLDNGDRLVLDGTECEVLDPIPTYGRVLVDGLSSGGVSDAVLRDRRHLAAGGTVIVTVALDETTGEILDGPEIISRGFLQPEDAADLFDEAADLVVRALNELRAQDDIDDEDARTVTRDTVTRFLRRRTGRRPVVVPVVMEV